MAFSVTLQYGGHATMLVLFYLYQSVGTTAQGKREITYQDLIASAEEFFKCMSNERY